jgi:hypothetical protein
MGGFDEVHLRSESGEALGHFAADRTGADDAEALGQFREREKRLVRQVRNLLQPRNRWGGGARTRGDDSLGETQGLASYLDRIRSGESTGTEKYVNTQLGEALAESCGLMSARNRRIRSMTLPKSTSTPMPLTRPSALSPSDGERVVEAVTPRRIHPLRGRRQRRERHV